MKQFILLTIYSLSFVTISHSQQLWGKVTESEFVNEALDIETDASGNSYIAGYITGETAFETTTGFPSAQGNGDIYVAKYSGTGNLIWVKRFGGPFSDRAYSIALDNSGNIFVTGQFFGTVDFDGHSITSTANSKDIFLIKLNNSGTTLWARSEGGAGSENAYGLACDNSGNVILTGQYEGNSTIAGQNFSSVIDPVTNLPSYDLFVAKYSSTGTPLWVRTGTAKYEERGLAVTADAQDNIYISGQFSDTLTIAGQTINNNAYNVGLVAKFSPAGTLIWFNTLRSGMVIPYDLKVNENNLTITGDCGSTFIYSNNNTPQHFTNNYSKTIFVLKTDLNGGLVWYRALGSDNELSARALAIDPGKNTYVTGYFSCSWSQFHQPQSALYNSVGFRDAYLWKVDLNGNLEFVKTFGGKLDDIGHGVAIINGNTPVICGGSTDDLNIPVNPSSSYTTGGSLFNLQHNTQDNYSFVHLRGDASRNSFITNAVNQLTPDYNYFLQQPPDSLNMVIFPVSDTIHACLEQYLFANPLTYPNAGPAYNYLWNTGSLEDNITVNTTGDYWVTIERNDECSSGGDSTHVIIHQLPALPTMTDNLGLAVNSPGAHYYTYHFCHPDSVQIWFNDLEPGVSIEINSGGNSYNDTLPHYHSDDGTVTVSSPYCQNHGYFNFNFDYASTYNYQPYLTLVDNEDYNDSITICLGDYVRVENHSYVNNPTGIFGILPNQPYISLQWEIYLNNNVVAAFSGDSFYTVFYPAQTGEYVYQLHAIIGYDNLCGIDTTHYVVTDTFFFEVLANPIAPIASISGNNLLCPNGSVYLHVDTAINQYSWSGPGIQWTSSDGDSIQVTTEGIFHYGGTFTDSVTGCFS